MSGDAGIRALDLCICCNSVNSRTDALTLESTLSMSVTSGDADRRAMDNFTCLVSSSLDLETETVSMSIGDSMSASAVHDGDITVGGGMSLFAGGVSSGVALSDTEM